MDFLESHQSMCTGALLYVVHMYVCTINLCTGALCIYIVQDETGEISFVFFFFNYFLFYS